VTWSLIFAFFTDYLTRFGCDPSERFSLFTCSTDAWFSSPGGDTFVEAYVQVTNTSGGWIWSSTLLMFVVPACLWLHIEGTRSGLSRTHQLAFLVLGFFGAISASFPLAFAFVNALQHCPQSQSAGWFHRSPTAEPHPNLFFLAVPAALAIISALALPYTVHAADRTLYVVALALLHVICLVPTLCNKVSLTTKTTSGGGQFPSSAAVGSTGDAKLAVLFATISGAAAVQHAHNLLQYATAAGTNPSWAHLLSAGWANDCQASISWDACLSGVACLVFLLVSPKRNTTGATKESQEVVAGRGTVGAVPFVLAALLVSVASSFSAFLACDAAMGALAANSAAKTAASAKAPFKNKRAD
jgi:hypothetical protein